eukprot:Skav210225  [mRNA]  locus=scaffold2492:306529:309574:- [translate_table: standard]
MILGCLGAVVWPLRAERQKEPRLDPQVPRPKQAPAVDKHTVKEDTQTLDEAISALKEAICDTPADPPQRKTRKPRQKPRRAATPEAEQTLEQSTLERLPAPDFGETLLFWKEYDSKPYKEKGLPAWHEDSQSPRVITPVPPPRTPRTPRTPRRVSRDWGMEAAVQRRLVAREQADWPCNSDVTVDFEVQLRSKERLRHMLRTGQKARVKKDRRHGADTGRRER